MVEREQPSPQTPVQETLARLEQAVSGIQNSDTFRAYLDAQARFHNYSFGNVLLILFQKPDATRVAGYKTWLEFGRHVKRGEKGVRILAPAHYRKKVQTDDGEKEEKHLFFRSTSVFDISQTEGAPLPEVAVPVLQGEQGAELYARLEGLALTQGLTVRIGHERFDQRAFMMGFYEPEQRLIAIREASQTQMVKTLAHELGHHYAEHQVGGRAAETEAESIAYVVLAHHGLDSGERSFPYVATWAQDQRVLRAVLGNIQRVSLAIIQGLEGQPQELEAPDSPPFVE